MAQTLRTQVEIRYSSILTFKDIYKNIVAPFAKLGNIEVNNYNSLEEYAVITIPQENILMDIRWDRMLFLCDGKHENIYSSNGPMMHFFQLLEKLQKDSGGAFGEIKALILGVWVLEVIDKSEEEIVKEFKAKFLQNLPILTNYQDNDLGVQMILNNDDGTIKLQYGPFKKSDIQTFQIMPMWSKEIQEILTKKGLLGVVTMIEKAKTAGIDTFKKMDRKVTEIIQQIKL